MSLFDTPEAAITKSKRGVPGAQLVKQIAMGMASQIMAKIPQGDDEFLSKVKASQTSTAALDELVKQECGDALNNEQVATFDHEEAQKILKSNQSNRSRRKNMAMTQANYVELLTAAIAEWVVRTSCDMQKSAMAFGGVSRQSMEINEATVAELAKDQEALGRAIRNIQSKKSTYKAKHADEDYEQDEAWQQLLAQETMLKAVRVTTPAGRKGVSIKKALQFIFDGVGETESLGKDESHQIIEACRNLSKGVYPQEFMDIVTDRNLQAAAEQAAEISDDVYSEAAAE